MKRNTVQVYPAVKHQIKDLKEYLNLNESETVAYLLSLHNLFNEKITKVQHDKLIDESKEMHNQGVL
jgi:hypothetical protein